MLMKSLPAFLVVSGSREKKQIVEEESTATCVSRHCLAHTETETREEHLSVTTRNAGCCYSLLCNKRGKNHTQK